ncbi:MAG: hypothetical protein HY075_14840 [Deltaproteobacteria bacterium]|nr:hypothetical protein [Deltaproteobacteria bacterium]
MANGTTQDQIQWLVRKNATFPGADRAQGVLVTGVSVMGPFLTDQVRSMVQQGMLEVDDELCPENSYWFGMNETSEVKRFLGLDNVVVARATTDEESTQPDLETTQPDISGHADDKTPPGLQPADVSAGENVNPDATGIITIKRPPSPGAPAQAHPQAAPARPAAAAAPAPRAPSPAQPQAQPPGPQSGKAAAAPARPPSAQEISNQFQRVVPAHHAPLAYSNPELQANAPGGTRAPGSILGLEKGHVWAAIMVAAMILAVLAVVFVIRSLRA